MSAKPDVPMKGLEIWAVEWEDAHWDSGEYQLHEITHRAVNYVSVGILVRDDSDGLMLATDICETGSFRGLNFVPAKMIVRRWRVGALKPASPRSRRPPTAPPPPPGQLSQTTSDTQS